MVCDVNSEKEQLQVKIFVFEKSEETLAMWRQNWLYAIDQKQRKNRKYAQIHFLDRQINFLLPLWEPVLPTVCDFKSEVEELPMIDFLGLVGEMWKKILLENIRKILGSKIVQVKGLMPPQTA